MPAPILVVEDGQQLTTRLARSGLDVSAIRPDTALRRPGFAWDMDIVVLGFPPGTHPIVEFEAYTSGPVLYVFADADHASVGPMLSRGTGPCPRCASVADEPCTPEEDTPSYARLKSIAGMGDALLDWAAATAVLETKTFQLSRVSTLGDAEMIWALNGDTGISARRVAAQPGCGALDCRS
ncbi:hypothetical protein [Tessaracoccus sp. OH4464_COT-324]|uniref:hypothetical protein n=1 Tax=Tessaracoccus sp. OH4464_COT-324 TaxID=2491059 RepID=UPI000F635CBF|nr:hypothetical protein [Tessaracoccus sp. OH4464_COT-324]RRD47453.1 hypothetical protein EII42_02365 [Tessaracoccus sp. OH4464_COT-324]